jgi:excisionase family DNA binding protein
LKKLLTEREAAELLQISISTLRRMRQAGEIKYVLIGSLIRYRVQDIEEVVK